MGIFSLVVSVAVAETVRVVEVEVAALPIVGAPQVVPELVGVGMVVYACRVNHREGVRLVIQEQIPS